MATYYLPARRLWASLTDSEQKLVMLQATANGCGRDTPPSDLMLARLCASVLKGRGLSETEIEGIAERGSNDAAR